MRYLLKNKVLFVWTLILCSCVEDYKMPSYSSGDFESELVVQGYILSGEKSMIYLSKTEPVYNELETEKVPNAEVKIIGENGYESKPAEYDAEGNCYVIAPEKLSPNEPYAIQITLDGEIYQSKFATIIDSPEIDEVTYDESEEGVSIKLSTFAGVDESRHYMWSYEEDWEFHAEIDFLTSQGNTYMYNKNTYPVLEPNTNPYYYCWGHSNSANIYIYSTGGLQENIVKEKELVYIPSDDIRLSYIYSILVKQWALSPEAYIYYKTLEDMSENTGGFFQVMPTELRGNVSCVSNPEIKVRGYVTSANVKTKRIFIYADKLEITVPSYNNCHASLPPVPPYSGWQMAWNDQVQYHGGVIYSKYGVIDDASILYSKECVDCTKTKGATKKRPDFWPTNHE